MPINPDTPPGNVGKQQGTDSDSSAIAVAAEFIRTPNCRNKGYDV